LGNIPVYSPSPDREDFFEFLKKGKEFIGGFIKPLEGLASGGRG
jgi:hypothetical protein